MAILYNVFLSNFCNKNCCTHRSRKVGSHQINAFDGRHNYKTNDSDAIISYRLLAFCAYRMSIHRLRSYSKCYFFLVVYFSVSLVTTRLNSCLSENRFIRPEYMRRDTWEIWISLYCCQRSSAAISIPNIYFKLLESKLEARFGVTRVLYTSNNSVDYLSDFLNRSLCWLW